MVVNKPNGMRAASQCVSITPAMGNDDCNQRSASLREIVAGSTRIKRGLGEILWNFS
jgi:hypothetical protein